MRNSDLRAFIRAIPKTETHLHIEGALPYELLHKLDSARFPEDPPFRRAEYRYPSFPEFDRTVLGNALPWFTSVDRYHEAAKVMFAGHVAQNVRYVETSFHLPVTEFINASGQEIIEAIRSAAPAGLEVRVFAGMTRDAYRGTMKATIESLHSWETLSGIDLHGFEQAPTESWTAPIWKKVRAAGKITKCHAGEFDGASRVREAIEVLGVRRVQHGVRAIEDPSVVRLAAESGTVFDVCPISNLRLKVVPSIAEHPLRRLIQAGVRCTVSTDDPLCFANTVEDEYLALALEGGFTKQELAHIARTGWEVALVESATRDRAIAEIAKLAAA